MGSFRKDLKKEIIKKYGSINEWTKQNDVSAERFYNFLKGEYNPTLRTLESWLKSVQLEISVKRKK